MTEGQFVSGGEGGRRLLIFDAAASPDGGDTDADVSGEAAANDATADNPGIIDDDDDNDGEEEEDRPEPA